MSLKPDQVTIRAPINIALIKYWGKLHEGYNIPLNSSFSLTLDRTVIYSETTVRMAEDGVDSFRLSNKTGQLVESTLPKNFGVLKAYFEAFAKRGFGVRVTSMNSFPTKAGLASSASGLSCIALCFCRLFNYFEESEAELGEDVFENIKLWFLANDDRRVGKVLAIVLLLRIISGSSCRSAYLFSVLQIGPDLLVEDGDGVGTAMESRSTIAEVLGLSNWRYQRQLEIAGTELGAYFNTKVPCKNDPDKLYERYNYLFTRPKDWTAISNQCVAFPLTTIGDLNRSKLIDFFKSIRLYVCLLHKEKKKVGSTDGMLVSALTSENLVRRVEVVKKNTLDLLRSVYANDVSGFLRVVMRDSNSFHSVCMDTYPPLFYLTDRSRDAVAFIHEFNETVNETVVGYTFDAGPNPFMLMHEKAEGEFVKRFKERFGVDGDDLIPVGILI